MNLVERRIRATSEEAVKLFTSQWTDGADAVVFTDLDEEEKVRVLAFWLCAVTLLHVVTFEVDTLQEMSWTTRAAARTLTILL